MKTSRERTAAYFKSLKHPQTDFIHRDGMISLFDNLVYALNLYQQKTKESGLEANALLARLFAFRIEGGLPKYLHSFPEKPDPAVSIQMLLALHHLRKHKVLMDALLREELQSLYDELAQISDEGLSYLSRLKLAAIRGQATLGPIDEFDGSSSAARANLAESFTLIKGGEEHLHRLFALYHPEIKSFCPPGFFEPFERGSLKKTALDALVNTDVEGEALLHTPLLPDDIEPNFLRDRFFTSEKNGLPWSVELGENYAVALIEKGREMVTYHAHSFYPFMFFMQGFSCLMSQPKGALFIKDGPSFEMVFSGDYSEDRLEQRELVRLFFTDHKELTFKQRGKCATTFDLNEPIAVEGKGFSMRLVFSSKEPFAAHLGIGSRPSETASHPHERGGDRILVLEGLGAYQEALVTLEVELSPANEALSTAAPIACMPLST